MIVTEFEVLCFHRLVLHVITNSISDGLIWHLGSSPSGASSLFLLAVIARVSWMLLMMQTLLTGVVADELM
jgi:hypothetical protein